MSTFLFPLFTNLAGRAVVVVGGGEVAWRKVQLLAKSQAAITVVAPELNASLQQWAEQNKIQWHARPYASHDLDNIWLVIAASDDTALNTLVSHEAEQRRIFANVVDDAELSSCQVPAIVDRAPITIAISSAGAAPMVARRIRARIESSLDHSLGTLTQLLQRYRQAIKQAFPQLKARRNFYDWVMDGPVANAIQAQQATLAATLLKSALVSPPSTNTGEVLLVGAGSGDPGLLTQHALRALNQADVILYDRLVDPAILELARRDALQISVGKQVGEDHHATQHRIHELMLEHAQQGHTVVRLKGGDAFIFGRGGEELEFLRAHQIPYKVIPGITAALACAAYSGIPLTHRDYAQSVQLITAHRKDDSPIENWHALSDPTQTVVVYMGLQQILHFITRLQAAGRAADTPCALIENGSRPEQRTLLSRIDSLAHYAEQHHFASPSLLIIGSVCSLAPTLHWYGEQINMLENTTDTAPLNPALALLS